MKIKTNISNIKTSATLAINELSNKLEKEGKVIYKFGLGQSPFPVPEIIVEELKKNSHQKDYLNVSGLEKLREVIAIYHAKKNKYNYKKENIIIGPGSKELIYQLQLVLDSDLILPSPSWVSYEPQAKILNKKIHWINCSDKNNWHLNPEDLNKKCKEIQKVNKLLILNSPNNPSGTTHNNLKEFAKVVIDNNIIVISDEIYAELDFTGEYNSLTHFCPENTIVSSGLSKWCGAGGWRIGYLVFPENLNYIKNAIRNIASETYTSVSAPIQYAAIKAFTEDHSMYLKNSRLILKKISEYIYKELLSVGIKSQKTQGGFYLICDFTKKIKKTNIIVDSKSLCNKILNDTGFAMLPGSDFGLNNKQLLSRIAFVDFDGKEALNLFFKNKNTDLKKICPKIIKGINKLKDWVIKN
tara:strand:- start:336 stop:1571 length:1236 start_codon:yes stop_codon:yes gene_type:complete